MTTPLPFHPLTVAELSDILSITIKHDDANKVITFLAELSAFTEDSQFNVSYNAPSSTGKSFIPTEIAKLFPPDSVLEIAHCTPAAFFHMGVFDKDTGISTVDLSRKVIIFLDQPHTQLIERLRPLLSHDKKVIDSKITDKSEKHGLRTKNVQIIGFPAVVFATAGMRVDEQESTRFLLLSPETSQGKITEAVTSRISRESDGSAYKLSLDADPSRKLLKERIVAIRDAHIEDIKIKDPQQIIDRFLKQRPRLKPRHSRDAGRLVSLVKSLALLNLWWRDRSGVTIMANDDDVQAAFELWEKISKSQDLNLPPIIYEVYCDVILSGCSEKAGMLSTNSEHPSMTRAEIMQKHHEVYGRPIDPIMLRQQYLPMLETAGLIIQEPDQLDKRRMLVYPTAMSKSTTPTNSDSDGGVNYLAAQQDQDPSDIGKDIPF